MSFCGGKPPFVRDTRPDVPSQEVSLSFEEFPVTGTKLVPEGEKSKKILELLVSANRKPVTL